MPIAPEGHSTQSHLDDSAAGASLFHNMHMHMYMCTCTCTCAPARAHVHLHVLTCLRVPSVTARHAALFAGIRLATPPPDIARWARLAAARPAATSVAALMGVLTARAVRETTERCGRWSARARKAPSGAIRSDAVRLARAAESASTHCPPLISCSWRRIEVMRTATSVMSWMSWAMSRRNVASSEPPPPATAFWRALAKAAGALRL